jgi:hypothetical protein
VGAAVALVLATFNPSGLSYYHWVVAAGAEFGALHALAGALLLSAWVLGLRASFASLGPLGLGLAFLVCASLVWLFAEWGWLDPSRPRVLAWVGLIVVGVILGVGLCWSLVRRRVTGQVDVDELPG